MGIQDLESARQGRRAQPTARGEVGARCLESLWIRLKVGDRLRPRDAETLRRLALPPFDRSMVYEVDCRGYVIAVGLPGETEAVDARRLLAAFEERFGVPVSFQPLPRRIAS